MQIKIEKRYIATIISVILLLAFAGYVIAVEGVSHTADEIISVDWSQITNRPAGLDDGDDVGGIEGGAIIWVGNVGQILKDGAHIPVISCKDTIHPYFNFYGQAKIENGKIYSRVWYQTPYTIACDSGWVEGNSAKCVYAFWEPSLKVDAYGATLTGHQKNSYGGILSTCTSSGKWT
ncbi:MAG: hypothetical protein PVG65_06900 [Candidatus Thorarchaeota archaeon]|jgi:hypothetical protein